MNRALHRSGLIALCLLALWGCTLTRSTDRGADSQPPPAAEVPATEWLQVAPGLEWREMAVRTASISSEGLMSVVRAAPAAAEIRLHHSPGAALTLADWRDRLPQSTAIVNGGFFDEQDRALGLLVADGQVSGASFRGFGGMLQVDPAGAVRVRSLVGEPYGGEPLWQAVQAFPMLIEAGGVQARQGDGFDVRSRRTWTGQDRAGRILFGVTPNLISLAELQAWLLASDLDLDIAFALDGGRSSGLFVNMPSQPSAIQPFDRLPVVIGIYSR